jgi:hypothetical protein
MRGSIDNVSDCKMSQHLVIGFVIFAVCLSCAFAAGCVQVLTMRRPKNAHVQKADKIQTPHQIQQQRTSDS